MRIRSHRRTKQCPNAQAAAAAAAVQTFWDRASSDDLLFMFLTLINGYFAEVPLLQNMRAQVSRNMAATSHLILRLMLYAHRPHAVDWQGDCCDTVFVFKICPNGGSYPAHIILHFFSSGSANFLPMPDVVACRTSEQSSGCCRSERLSNSAQ